MKVNYGRQLVAMTDDELESFVDKWMARKSTEYHSTERFSGAGDMGRDVVGYCTSEQLAGPWHNYQCKQLGRKLGEAGALLELGKVIFHSSEGNYSLPKRFVFVAPRGVGRGIQNLIADPLKLKAKLIEKWDQFCGSRISEGVVIPLSTKISESIEEFDFSSVSAVDAAKMLKDPHIKPVLVEWFGEDPGQAPSGTVPAAIQPSEAMFIAQLVNAYSEREGSAFSGPIPVMAHSIYGDHLRLQRTRYFDAASFQRYYRDNTPHEYVAALEEDVFHGVIEVHKKSHSDVLSKVDEVMIQAACVQPAGVLARYARVTVKQGLCHHFANEGRLPWKK